MCYRIEIDQDLIVEIKNYIDNEFISYMKEKNVNVLDYKIENNSFNAFELIDPSYLPCILLTFELGFQCNFDISSLVSAFFMNFSSMNNKSIEIDEKNKKYKIIGYKGKDAVDIIRELKK